MECLRTAYLQVVTELLGEELMVHGGRLESHMLNSVTKICEGLVAMGIDVQAPWTSARGTTNAEKLRIRQQKVRNLVAAELLLLEQQRLSR